MRQSFSVLSARVLATLAGFLLVVAPASACPVSQADGQYDLASVVQKGEFSPVSTMRVADAPQRATRAMAATECEGGLAGTYPCNNIDLMAFMPLADIGGGEGNDIWGWTDSLTGKEYALMGRTSGTSFVDISDPENPIYLGNLPTHTNNSSWRDVKVYADHAFIVSEASGHGMQVFDLTQLRSVASPPQTFANTAHYSNFGNAHNIAINTDTGFAYAVGTSTCSGGLHMVDISTPGSPAFAGCYSADGYTHDTQCVIFDGPSHRFHHGSEICFNSNEDTLTIVDVTNKSAPVQLARLPYPNDGYTHQGWLTDDHQYFLLDDELDETSFGHNTKTRIFNISDPANPSLIGAFDSTAAAIDHNLYVRGDYAFQANYRAGLRILKLTDVANGNLTEEAFFDIYPASDSADFNGAWSNYPYFDSGTVIVSGIEQGLFVLRPTSLTPSFDIEPEASLLELCGAGSASTTVDISPVAGFADPVTLSGSGQPPGAVLTLNPTSVTPPGNVSLTVDVANPIPGQYMLAIDGDSAGLVNSAVVNLNVSVAAPEASAPLLPADGETGISANQTLNWSAGSNVYSYDLQIATDPAFSNVIVDAPALSMNSFPASALPSGTQLYWRLVSRNACGDLASPTWTFTTAVETCSLFASTDVPVLIDSGPANTVTSSLVSNAGGQIVDVNVVGLNGTHTYLGDLDFQLEGPIASAHGGVVNTRHASRALVRIINRQCSSLDNFDLSLDEDAPAGPLPCPYNDGGTYQPANTMQPFFGSTGTGDWLLIVNDNAGIDGGSLNGWGIELCTTPLPLSLDSDGDGVPDAADNCIEVPNADQRDTHGDGYGNICDPDVTNDGIVNLFDLVQFKSVFAANGDLDEDFNGDGVVNLPDLIILKAYFFGPPGPSGVALQ